MKKIIFSIFIIGICSSLNAQKSCCARPAESTETFAMLTQDENFVATHLDPKPFVLENPIGKEISFKTKDGINGHAYEIKAAKPTNNYVFVIHEWWGLNDYIKQESEKIEKIQTLQSPILFVWPKQDQWINKEMVERFENNMKVAYKTLTVEAYEADHAFANPSNPKYSKSFADDAFNKAMEFIKLNLK